MFNRTLQRPMFRIGGSAGTGITTGLNTPKRGLVNGPGKYSQSEDNTLDNEIINQRKLRSDVDFLKSETGNIPKREPYPYKASDFFMGLGSGILAQPGGQPIFQTIGKAAQVPLETLQKTQLATWGEGQDDKVRQWQSDKELVLSAYKNMNKEDKDKLWATAVGYHKHAGINPETGEAFKSPQEAYTLLLKEKFGSEYRKQEHPDETALEKKIREEKRLNQEVQLLITQFDLGKPDAVKLQKFMEDDIAGKYKLPSGGSGGAGRKYHIEPDDVIAADDPKDKRLAIKNYDPDKDDYEDGTIYINFRNNIVYVKKGPLFIPYDDYMAETINID